MTKVRYVGDIHGEYGTYFQTIQNVDHSVQVGDYGFGFGPLPIGLENLNKKGDHRFIRGNHDSPTECALQHNWIKDGTIETHGQDKIMYIGGAFSIDKEYRIPDISWWADEELSWLQLQNMIDKFEDEKPDVMITHELPEILIMPIMTSSNPHFRKFNIGSRTRDAFSVMIGIHKPKVWIFGHWHQDVDVVIDGTRFICLDCHSYLDFDHETGHISPVSNVHVDFADRMRKDWM